jgi:pSer/pThr/pTyr-binding forkhead associated (FHA) protein
MAKLVLSSGGAILHQAFLDKERVSIGRDSCNQVVIDDPAIALEHAVITPLGNDHILEDLESEAGTFVNGARVSRHILQHGDVIELGAFYLRYLNPRASSEMDLERTMLISGLRRVSDAGQDAPSPQDEARVPAAPSTKVRFPKGSITVLAGDQAGRTIELDRVVATFGQADGDLAVVTRRPHGYFITQVQGRRRARVNGQSIAGEPRALTHGDVIDIGNQKLEFRLG